ncbi:glycosyltransferase family 39 protein [Streptomyces sp. H27-C3]|uniref:glycosyltransferase family 39 protein n=1 Tax=Streptomyces sp. H27-C3 TaxID=3046305 RepID=UPI0024B9AFF7|nr:glycosyltransferase family 39 protein [Streptomyces sp. H27-C3]MDJ0465087.1 glycosyltransferase family 39 protein [Streptomyces sp. H27-C3]
MPPTAPPVTDRHHRARRRSAPTFQVRRERARERVVRPLRRAAPALLGYFALRMLGVVVLGHWSHLRGHGLWPALATSWDSGWYLEIADQGYDSALGTRRNSNNLAFFPLYPALVKAVAGFTPGSRASVGLLIAAACSLVAAWGIFAIGDHLYGRRAGTALTVLWGSMPVAIVQWMGYTEALFTALTAWALYAVLTGRWLWAGSLAALAGLTRPTGIAVAAAVSVTAAVLLWQSWRRERGVDRAVLAAGLLAPLGWFGYVAWVGLRLGRWDGYFAVQKLWLNEWDGGADTLREMRRFLLYQSRPHLFLVVVTVVLIASVALYLVCLADRLPLPLLVFTGVLLLVVIGSGGVYFPRARFLVPGFPLLLPIALAVVRARPLVAVLVMGGMALSSVWFGAYTHLLWTGPP